MSFWMVLRISIKALVRNKMRTFLTALGIIIGVATVITMLAIGSGARASVEENLSRYGTNTLFIYASASTKGGVRGASGTHHTLVPADIDAVARECPSVMAAAPMVRDGIQAVYQNQNWQTGVTGSSPGFFVVRAWRLASGSYFTDSDVRSAAKVVVLGKKVADELFGNVDPVGKMMRLRGIPFKVLGVLAGKGDSAYGGSQDDMVVVPYTTAMKRLSRRDNIHWAMVSARSAEHVEKARKEISGLLRQRHRLAPDDDDDFTLETQKEWAEAADESAKIFTLLLGGIASVSLLVGGIGIMNIMLVSVTERIREIGIRMAMGARARDIMMQFLVEATLLSVLGGLIGIGLGIGLAYLASGYSEWPLVITPDSITMSFGFSAVVGVFFGLYPAVKASRLDPIQALRHE